MSDTTELLQGTLDLLAGDGVSFDGINGFHPLWMAISIAGFALQPWLGSDATVRALLFVAVAMNLAAGYVVYRLLCRWTRDATASLFVLTAYVLSPAVPTTASMDSKRACLTLRDGRRRPGLERVVCALKEVRCPL